MFSLRDTLAATFLGVQIEADDSTSNSNPDKKGKKKSHKKRSSKGKKKSEESARGVGDEHDEGFESVSDGGHGSDDEEAMSFAQPTSQSLDAKLMSAMVYQFESTQIEDPLQIMIRKLAADCKVETTHVSETVNRMFDLGLPYDDYEAVKKELMPKAARPTINTNEEARSNYSSALTSPVPSAAVTSGAKGASGSTATAKASASTHLDADAAAALAKLTGSSGMHKPAPIGSAVNGSQTKPAAAAPAPATHASTAPSVHQSHGPAVSNGTTAPTATVTAVDALASMKQKLDYVAGFSQTSLYDSLVALCSWAATTTTAGGNSSAILLERAQKMEAFFHSQALEILLNTLLSDDSQQLQRPEVRDAFQALLLQILLPPGQATPSANAAVIHLTESLQALIAQVSGLRNAQILPAFASPTAHGHGLLAGQIAACVKGLYLQLNPTPVPATVTTPTTTTESTAADSAEADSSNDALLGKLAAIDAQLAALSKSAKKTAAPTEVALEKVQNMFLGREMQSDKLQLCLESVQRMASSHTAAPSTTSTTASTPVLPPKPSITSAELHRSVADSSSAIERTLLLECNTLLLQQPHSPTVSRIAPGPSASASLQSKQQQNHHITHHYERLSYERDSKLAMLTNEIGTVNMRLQELAAHKKRLLDQVAMCDQEIGALNARSTALGADLTNNTRYYQQQLEQLANTGNSVRKSLQAHDQVNNLVNAVRTFEQRFADALLQQQRGLQAASVGAAAVGASGSAGKTTVLTASTVGAHIGSGGASAASGEAQQHQALLAERVQVLSGALRSYIASEGQCVRFLSERVETAQGKLATARKELLAYAALSMKGAVVQTAEATVTQLDGEIREDQLAARQLLQNVAVALGRVKALQAALNPPAATKGKAPAPGKKGADPVPAAPAVAYTVDVPGSECARILRYCAAMEITAPPEIVAAADGASAPPSPVKAAAPAAHPAPAVSVAAPAKITETKATPAAAATIATASTTITATGEVRIATQVLPVDALRASRERAAAKSAPQRDGKTAGGERDGRKRSAPESGKTSTSGSGAGNKQVDTLSAIEKLEKSVLQKQSVGGPAKPTTTSAPAPAAVKAPTKVTPVQSVWKVPNAVTNSSSGSSDAAVTESKQSEGSKTLREIQAEQLREKQRGATKSSEKHAEKSVTDATTKNSAPTATTAAAEQGSAATVSNATALAAVETVDVVDRPAPASTTEVMQQSSVGNVDQQAAAPADVTTPGPKSVRKRSKKAKTPNVDRSDTLPQPVDSNCVGTEAAADGGAVGAIASGSGSGGADEGTAVGKRAAEGAPATPLPYSQVSTKKSKKKGKNEPVSAVAATPAATGAVRMELDTTVEDSKADALPAATAQSPKRAPAASPPSSGPVRMVQTGKFSVLSSPVHSAGEASSLHSPLVEFHSTYPSLDDHVPIHESMENAAFSAPGVSDTHDEAEGEHGSFRSPLVEYHSAYPDHHGVVTTEDCEDLLFSPAATTTTTADVDGDADRSFDFQGHLLNSAGTVKSSTTTASKVRDINPLSRPSPGRSNSFRVKLDMSQAGEGEGIAGAAAEVEAERLQTEHAPPAVVV